MWSLSWLAGVQALVTPTLCVWFWWLEQGCSAFSLTLHLSFIAIFHPPHTPLQLTALHVQHPGFTDSTPWTIYRLGNDGEKKLKEHSLLYNSTLCLHSIYVNSLYKTSLQGLRLLHPKPETAVFIHSDICIIISECKSECILVLCACAYWVLFGWGRW